MDKDRDQDESAAAKIARELVELRLQAVRARTELARLRQDVIAAESRLDDSQAAQLIEANEQLMVSTLQARADAEACSQALEEVSRSAGLDPLTKLTNRLLLLDRFEQAIAHARRHGTPLALLFLDLDNFKHINDALGHTVGDEVLKLAAHRLASSVRDVDTVSRHGGDEFLILLPEVSLASDAALIADKLIAALAAPSRVGDHVLRLTASIGISLYPADGQDVETLISRADAAMYRAKRRGLGRHVFHHDDHSREPDLSSPVLASLQPSLAHYEMASAEHERRHGQLREANGQLVMAALGAQDLQVAAQRAQQQQKEFLAVMAHELRNPLTSIRLAATMLGPDGTQQPARMQAIIEREVVHMARLVSDLLDVSRANTGKLRLERKTIDLTDVIDQAVDACRPAMDTRLQRFVAHVPACPLEVHGDQVRLAQIISNLLDNASKYTPDGGEIGLAVRLIDDAIMVTVSDSGIGITAEALPQVFEPFVQDPRAIGFNELGLGIGLTVVRELVEAHGGQVVANSGGAGLGSQFVVTLPSIKPSAAAES